MNFRGTAVLFLSLIAFEKELVADNQTRNIKIFWQHCPYLTYFSTDILNLLIVEYISNAYFVLLLKMLYKY